jgi:hypothetical protein
MMTPRSKTMIILVCLFLISFKVAAAGVFVQAALERAHQAGDYSQSLTAHPSYEGKSPADDKSHPASSLNLMSHITAIESKANLPAFKLSSQTSSFWIISDPTRAQNIPDPAFKPPKTSA